MADVVYRAKHLTFRRKEIDALPMDGRFRVITPDGTFEMSKADFLEVFDNVAKSNSYAVYGNYVCRPVPARALRFRIEGGADDEV